VGVGPRTTLSYLSGPFTVLLSAVLYVVLSGQIGPEAANSTTARAEVAVILVAVLLLVVVSADSMFHRHGRRVG